MFGEFINAFVDCPSSLRQGDKSFLLFQLFRIHYGGEDLLESKGGNCRLFDGLMCGYTQFTLSGELFLLLDEILCKIIHVPRTKWTAQCSGIRLLSKCGEEVSSCESKFQRSTLNSFFKRSRMRESCSPELSGVEHRNLSFSEREDLVFVSVSEYSYHSVPDAVFGVGILYNLGEAWSSHDCLRPLVGDGCSFSVHELTEWEDRNLFNFANFGRTFRGRCDSHSSAMANWRRAGVTGYLFNLERLFCKGEAKSTSVRFLAVDKDTNGFKPLLVLIHISVCPDGTDVVPSDAVSTIAGTCRPEVQDCQGGEGQWESHVDSPRRVVDSVSVFVHYSGRTEEPPPNCLEWRVMKFEGVRDRIPYRESDIVWDVVRCSCHVSGVSSGVLLDLFPKGLRGEEGDCVTSIDVLILLKRQEGNSSQRLPDGDCCCVGCCHYPCFPSKFWEGDGPECYFFFSQQIREQGVNPRFGDVYFEIVLYFFVHLVKARLMNFYKSTEVFDVGLGDCLLEDLSRFGGLASFPDGKGARGGRGDIDRCHHAAGLRPMFSEHSENECFEIRDRVWLCRGWDLREDLLMFQDCLVQFSWGRWGETPADPSELLGMIEIRQIGECFSSRVRDQKSCAIEGVSGERRKAASVAKGFDLGSNPVSAIGDTAFQHPMSKFLYPHYRGQLVPIRRVEGLRYQNRGESESERFPSRVKVCQCCYVFCCFVVCVSGIIEIFGVQIGVRCFPSTVSGQPEA